MARDSLPPLPEPDAGAIVRNSRHDARGAHGIIAAYEAADRVSDHIEAYHDEFAPDGDIPDDDEPSRV